MSRPRIPTKVLELRGSFAKDPQRKENRAAEPEPSEPLGAPPTSFDPDAQGEDAQKKEARELTAIWQELRERAPAGVLEKTDDWLVEITCRLMWEFRQHHASITASKVNLLVSCLARMGMTPSDRSKVGVLTKKENAAGERDELADFAAQTRAHNRSPN